MKKEAEGKEKIGITSLQGLKLFYNVYFFKQNAHNKVPKSTIKKR